MTRRVVQLFVLLGVVVAVYLVLSLFDHAARADGGSSDHLGVTGSVAAVTEAKKVIAKTQSITPKSTVSRSVPQKSQRPTAKVSEVKPLKAVSEVKPLKAVSEVKGLKAKAPKIQGTKAQVSRKIQASTKIQASGGRTGEAIRRVAIRTSKVRLAASGAVRATVSSARTAVVQRNLSSRLSALPRTELGSIARLPDLPRVEVSAWSRLPGLPQAQLPALPQAQLPALPQAQLPALPQAQLPALPQASGSALGPASPPYPGWSQMRLPTRMAVPIKTTDFGPVHLLSHVLSDVSKPPAAQAQPRRAPHPAEPRQPGDRSTSTGQARDSGAGNAPAMGTVSSPWRPEVMAGSRRLAADFILRGRTVRYAGPPS